MVVFKYITPEWVSAIGSIGAAVSVYFAFRQLRVSKEIAQLQFEDSLAKEYRDLATRIPTKALLGDVLSEEEYQEAFDELFRYIDLTNEQVLLRQRKRINEDAWNNWSSGIKANLQLPSFQRAWSDVKQRCQSFQELRRLENEKFLSDPVNWN